ncbi:MAG TPA: O-antigen ligase family protein [Albitalea sp.]|uniref:O-antigen ligase family protein n=1 Tax=Piscinibacter sp. TaxID=1903157 RepID=UPI002ED5F857
MLSALAFLAFCVVCSIWAFTRHPVYGFYFYLASFYVHPPSRWWSYALPDLRWALLSAAITVLAVMFHRGRLAPKPAPWIANTPGTVLTLYTVWMWIQMPWALDFPTHFSGSVQYLKYLVAIWFVYRICDSKETIRQVMLGHVLGCTVLGIFCQFTGRSGGRLDGVGGPGLDEANALAMFLATGVICCFGLFMTWSGWRRWAALLMLAIIGNGFVLANSRGAFLGLVAGGLTVMLCKAREHRRVFWAIAMVGIVGFAVIVDTTFIERMFTIGDVVEQSEDADISARSRMEIMKAQVHMAADYPLGAGHRGTAELSPRYLDRKWLTTSGVGDESEAARSSHNTFMTTLVEQGIPGAILFLILVFWIFGAVVRVRRLNRMNVDPELITLGSCLVGGLMVVIVAGNSTDYLLAEVQFWLYAALVSLLQIGEARKPANALAPAPLSPLPLRR